MKKWMLSALLLVASLQAAPTTVLNESSLEQLISKGRVVIDFSSEDCVPCRRFKPIFDQVSDELKKDFTFAQVTIIDPSNIWDTYNIQSVPTVILFEEGKEVRRHGSFATKDALTQFLVGDSVQARSSADIKALNSGNFDHTIASGDTIVEFYVDWCSACQRFAPTYAQVAEELSQTSTFAKLAIPDGRQIADRYQVKRTPTLIVFRNGAEIGRHEGGLSADALKAFINNTLN